MRSADDVALDRPEEEMDMGEGTPAAAEGKAAGTAESASKTGKDSEKGGGRRKIKKGRRGNAAASSSSGTASSDASSDTSSDARKSDFVVAVMPEAPLTCRIAPGWNEAAVIRTLQVRVQTLS